MLETVYAAGSASGREADKFNQLRLEALTGPVLGLPVMEDGCSAWMECRILPEPRTENAYDTFFAEIVAAAADPRVFAEGRWSFSPDNADLHTMHHLGGGSFILSGDVQRARSGGQG